MRIFIQERFIIERLVSRTRFKDALRFQIYVRYSMLRPCYFLLKGIGLEVEVPLVLAVLHELCYSLNHREITYRVVSHWNCLWLRFRAYCVLARAKASWVNYFIHDWLLNKVLLRDLGNSCWLLYNSLSCLSFTGVSAYWLPLSYWWIPATRSRRDHFSLRSYIVSLLVSLPNGSPD